MVAEGVETLDVLELLRRLGCDLAQGFHIGRPIEGSRLPPGSNAWLASQRTGIGMAEPAGA